MKIKNEARNFWGFWCIFRVFGFRNVFLKFEFFITFQVFIAVLIFYGKFEFFCYNFAIKFKKVRYNFQFFLLVALQLKLFELFHFFSLKLSLIALKMLLPMIFSFNFSAPLFSLLSSVKLIVFQWNYFDFFIPSSISILVN